LLPKEINVVRNTTQQNKPSSDSSQNDEHTRGITAHEHEVLRKVTKDRSHQAESKLEVTLDGPLDPKQSLIEQIDRVKLLIPAVFFGDVRVGFEAKRSTKKWVVTVTHNAEVPEGQALSLAARSGLVSKEHAQSILAPLADDDRRKALQQQYDQAVQDGADRQAEELLQQIQQSPKDGDPAHDVLEKIYEQFEKNPNDFVFVSGGEFLHLGGEGGDKVYNIFLILMRTGRSVEVFPLSIGRENHVSPQSGMDKLLRQVK